MVNARPLSGPTQDKRPLAFLCHSSGDKERVRQLCQQLKADGYQCWFDEEDLLPGQNWEREINHALRRSDYIIVCLSQSSVTKRGFVQKEIKTALDIADELPDGEIFLIPVRLEHCEPPDRLRILHWVDLFSDTGYRQLTRALQPRGLSNATVPASAWDRIIPPELERQQSVPWQKYQASMTSIYISYRRDDAALITGRLYDGLRERFGPANVFMDIDTVALGIDLREATVRAISQSRVVLVVVGHDWFERDQHGERRIDSPDDFTRFEVETAIRLRRHIFLVLVDNAAKPHASELPSSLRSLADQGALRLRHDNFDRDASLLAGILAD